MAVQGNLPRRTICTCHCQGGDVAALLAALSTYIPTQTIGIVLDFFAYMAIASSFLGVTLGLFDYITDLLQWGNSLWGRIKTALVTFLPPLMMSFFLSLWICYRHRLCWSCCELLLNNDFSTDGALQQKEIP